MNNKKRSVLFLCTGNSARSQMAEALLKHKAGDKFEVYSAGTHPENVDTRAVKALKQFGVEASDLVSKGIDTFEGQTFDFVITLCDKANNECKDFPNAVNQYSWDFPDPKTHQGFIPFTTILYELDNRISMFLLVEKVNDKSIKNSVTCDNLGNTTILESKAIDDYAKSDDAIVFDPVNFYKNLTDEIRLKVLMLSHYHGELCVCELMEALAEDSQPKVSRNLALLRKSNIITARKHGQWVFYRINPVLPQWAKTVIAQTTENNISMVKESLGRLAKMKDRPNKTSFCT